MTRATRSVVILCDGASASGGTERVAIGSAIGLADRGWPVGFFGAEGELDPRLKSHPNLRAISLELEDAYHAGKGEVLRRFLYFPEGGSRFKSFLNDFDPEETVVHVHAFRRIHTAAAVRAARGYPRVLTLHDYGLVDPNTGFYDFGNQAPCPLRPLSAACFARQCTKSGWSGKAMQMARAVVNGPLLHVAREFDHFVHVSPFAQEIFRPYLPRNTQETIIENPVDVSQAARVQVEHNEEFLFVGRLQPEKGADLFAQVARAAGVRAVFVGEGPEAESVSRLNPAAEQTGWLSADQLAARLERARAVVFPSRWYETAGLAALEALARGVPVIVSDVCAASRYVLDRQTGRHFRSGDADSLAQVLREVAEQDPRPMSEAAYDRYWANPFTLGRHVDALEVLYTQLLQR